MKVKHVVSRILRKIFPKQMELCSAKISHKKQLRDMEKFAAFSQEDWINYDKELYLKATGRELNLESPQRFTEKIQWRKLFDIDPIYAQLSDKLAVRDWVAKKIGEEYLIPLLAVYDSADEINFDELPDQFVIKTNNASATNTIVTCKSKINERLIRENYRFWMKYPFGYYSAERHYNLIESKIIVEKYMQPDKGKSDLTDYKFFCFDGKPVYCQIISNRNSNETIDFYDMDWQWQEYRSNSFGNLEGGVKKPACFEQMKGLANKLSDGFAFVRVDFYEVQGRVYFGEMTFTPASGYNKFTPDEWDYKIGELWDITVPQIDRAKAKL